MSITADYLIKKLNLKQHPEGGWYTETYRSEEEIPEKALPKRFHGSHCFSTCIYFLLKSGEYSKFHRIKSDEQWHFYSGSPVKITNISRDGKLKEFFLGKNLENGEKHQIFIPAETWMAAYPLEENSYSLIGCTAAPGFEFQDFELADKQKLKQEYPQFESIIDKLC